MKNLEVGGQVKVMLRISGLDRRGDTWLTKLTAILYSDTVSCNPMPPSGASKFFGQRFCSKKRAARLPMAAHESTKARTDIAVACANLFLRHMKVCRVAEFLLQFLLRR